MHRRRMCSIHRLRELSKEIEEKEPELSYEYIRRWHLETEFNI